MRAFCVYGKGTNMNGHSDVRHLRSRRGQEAITSSSTMEDFLEDWLWNKQSLRPSTHASYEVHVRRYLMPFLGKLHMDELHDGHVQRMYRVFADQDGRGGKPLSVSSLRRIHATLMSAM